MPSQKLLDVCNALAGVTEEILWDNDRVFKVGGKMFFCGDASDDPAGRFSFKVADERFLELTDLPGVIPAPYLARAKWVQIDPVECALGDDELAVLISNSYELVFARLTKKAQRSIKSDD